MGRALRLYRGVWWYLREVSGETAYDRYVEHARRDHPGEPVMSYREFFRERQKARYAIEEGRLKGCC